MIDTFGVAILGKAEQGKSVNFRCPRASAESDFPAARRSPLWSSPARRPRPSRYAMRSPFSETPAGPRTRSRRTCARSRRRRAWAHSNGLSLEARMATGAGLELREVESLSHALKTARVPDRTERPHQANVLSLSRSGKELHRHLPHDCDEMLDPQTGANRVRSVAAYLDWLASHSRAAGSQQLLRDTVKALTARAKVGTRQPSEPRRAGQICPSGW